MQPLDSTPPEVPAHDIVVIDFETYWADDFTLSKLTTEAYVRDPQFEVIGCGISVGGAEPLWFVGHEAIAAAFAEIDWSKVACLAHHAHFDGLILKHHFGHAPAFWFDTLSMGRAVWGTEVGGSLGALAKRYGIGEKGDEVIKSKNKRLRDFSPEDLAAYGRYCCNDVTLTYQLLLHLLGERGGFPAAELWQIDTTIRQFTEPVLRTDGPLLVEAVRNEKLRKSILLAAAAGIPLGVQARDTMRAYDRVLAVYKGAKAAEQVAMERELSDAEFAYRAAATAFDGSLKAADEELIRQNLVSNDKFAELLADLGIDPPRKVSNATGKETWAFAKSDPGFAELLEHENDEVRWVAEARVGVKSTIVETRAERLRGIGERGAVPIYLKYCGAHTGRWSGGDKMNPQNFNRGGALRDALIAPPGCVVVAVDSGQIEARGVGWLADHREFLDAFRAQDADPKASTDVYTRAASQVFGRLITKANKVERHVGKTEVLGLGYSMGHLKLAMTLASGPMGFAPIIFTAAQCAAVGVDIGAYEAEYGDKVAALPSRLPYAERLAHCAFCKRIVDMYRKDNGPIVGLWRECEEVLEAIEAIDEGAHEWRNGITLSRHSIRLPSGRWLRYPGLRQADGGYVYQAGRKGERVTHIYGGLLTENLTQALARDIVAAQMLTVRTESGYRTSTSTHDEAVWVVPETVAGEFTAYAIETMRRPPAWAQGWPLNAEGGYGTRYGDAK